MGLKQKALSGVKWTSFSAIFTALVQLLQVAVLTRFLDKSEFGLMAMAVFVIGISNVFIDMGISNVIIHKQSVSRLQLSTLYWLNVILGLVIYLIVLSVAPAVAYFYNTPELKDIIHWSALSFLILPWGQQFDTLLKKDFRFKSLTVRDTFAKSVSFVTAVVLAYLGYGVYALVFANLGASLISTILLVLLGLQSYKPDFAFSISSIRSKGFFSFGLFQMGEKLINYLNKNIDTLLIGKILGMDALGLYEVAKNLAYKPYLVVNPVITKVAFPSFAKVQHDLHKLKIAYLKVVNSLTFINAPLHLAMIIFAEPIIGIVFGSNWSEAVPIFQLLTVFALCSSIGNPVGALQLALGRADLGFYWNLGRFFVIPLVIWIGAQSGLIGVALALSVFGIISIFYVSWLLFIRKLVFATYKEYFNSFSLQIAIALISSLVTIIFLQMNLLLNNISILIIGGVLYLLTFTFINIIFNKKLIIEYINLTNFIYKEKIMKLFKF